MDEVQTTLHNMIDYLYNTTIEITKEEDSAQNNKFEASGAGQSDRTLYHLCLSSYNTLHTSVGGTN